MASVAPPPGLEAMIAAPAGGPQAVPGGRGGVPAPPGLEGAPPKEAGWAGGPSAVSLAQAEAQSHPGLWVNAVLAASSHLSPEGLHHALGIVDRAIRNAQHAKALDELIGTADESDWASTPYLKSAACLKAQISSEQLMLLGELQQLRVFYGGAPEAAQAAPPAAQKAAPLPPAVVAAVPVPERVPAAVAPRVQPKAQAGKTSERTAAEKPQGRQAIGQAQTLSTSLQLLSRENPECLFIVRHINKLGFKASRTLKRHYSAYGPVVRVLVAHSTVRQHGSPDCHARRRPSSLGFMQMASPEAVKAILAAGPEQEVDGSTIRIQKFERQQSQPIHENDEDQVDEGQMGFERYISSGSDNSLATVSTGISDGSCTSKGSSLDAPLVEAEAAESDSN